MTRDEYVELRFGANSIENLRERERSHAEQNVSRRLSNTEIIHEILWRAVKAEQRSTADRIRRAGIFD